MMGYSIKTGLLEHGLCDAETASETPLWKKLVPTFTSAVLYLFDLGFFERALFLRRSSRTAELLPQGNRFDHAPRGAEERPDEPAPIDHIDARK
jgi:hypothetical protein